MILIGQMMLINFMQWPSEERLQNRGLFTFRFLSNILSVLIVLERGEKRQLFEGMAAVTQVITRTNLLHKQSTRLNNALNVGFVNHYI